MLYSSSENKLPPDAPPIKSPALVTALRGEAVRLEDDTLFIDEASYGLLSPLSSGWALSFTRPRADLDSALWREFLTEAVPIGSVIVFVSFVVALLAQGLTKAVVNACGYGRGGHTRPKPSVPRPRTNREVAELSHAMELMASAISEREASLQKLAETAQRAHAQTARLQAVTAALSEVMTPHGMADAIIQAGVGAVGARSGIVALLAPLGDL